MYKGLSGGYTGRFVVEPYFERWQRDNYLEDRKILFCDLNLFPEQLENFQLHYMEMRTAGIPYFYKDANCSLLLGKFLNVAVDSTVVPRQFFVLPGRVFNSYSRLDSQQSVFLRVPLIQRFDQAYNTLSMRQKGELLDLLYTDKAPGDDKIVLETFMLISDYLFSNQPEMADTLRRNREVVSRKLAGQTLQPVTEVNNFTKQNTRSFELKWRDSEYLEMFLTPICFTEYEQMRNLEIVNTRILAFGLQNDLRDSKLRLKIEPANIEYISQTNAVLSSFSWSVKSSFIWGDSWGADQEIYGGYALNILNTGLFYVLAGGNLTNYTDFTERNFRPLDFFAGAQVGYKQALTERLGLRLAYTHKYTLDSQSIELFYKVNTLLGKVAYSQTKSDTEYRLGLEILY
jgi:hypothetical protein